MRKESRIEVGLTAKPIHSRPSAERQCLVLGTPDIPGQAYYSEIQEEIEFLKD